MNSSLDTPLEDDIRATFGELAEQTTIDADPTFGRRTTTVTDIRPGRSRWLMPAAAAIAGLALVGGLVATTRNAAAPAPPADQVLPPPDTIGEPGAPVEPANTASVQAVVGLFPTGGIDDVIAAGFDDPGDAASAYFQDRVRPGAVPDVYDSLQAVVDLNAIIIDDSGSRAVARVGLQLPEDSADSYVLMDQVARDGQPKRWVVSGTETASFGLDSLRFENGTVSGSYTSEIGGLTEVTIYDATTGDVLAPTLDVMPAEEVDLDEPDNAFPAALGRFEFTDVDVAAVAIRLWNTNAQPGGTPVALFAESLVRQGESIDFDGAHPIADAVDGVDEATPRAFRDLGAGDSKVVVDDTVAGAQVKVSLREAVEESQAGQRAPMCVDLELDGSTGSACFSVRQVTNQSLGFDMESADGSRVLVGSIVPDATVSITRQDGLVIRPIGNVWFDIVDTGAPQTYTIAGTDGLLIGTQNLG